MVLNYLFYIRRTMWKNLNAENILSSICVDSIWFSCYMDKERNYKHDVVKWMLRDKVFTKRYVFIPICLA